MLDKIGIGIDLVKIEKFRKLEYETNTHFYQNAFSGKFALKEATIKSIGKKIPLTSIFTDHINSQPIVKIENSSEYSFIATISHEDEFAVAVVISEKL